MKPRWAVPEWPRTIFVLKPSSFGDIIHTLPAVHRLKERWPESRISWLVNPEWSPLLQGTGLVDEIVVFPRREFRGWRGLHRFPQWLRNEIHGRHPDLTVDYQGLLRSALIGRAAGAHTFYGLDDAREGARWLYDGVAPSPAGVPHAVERYLALSDWITGQGDDQRESKTTEHSLIYPLPMGNPPDDQFPLAERFFLLNPFSRGAIKSLGLSQVKAIINGLSPHQVVVVGKNQNAISDLPANALNLLNHTTLLQLVWLIRRAAFVISVDSGPAHMAAALHTPMVALHTWSDPRRVGPHWPAAWVLKNGTLLRSSELNSLPESFFARRCKDILPAAQCEAICRLAISSSNSFA